MPNLPNLGLFLCVCFKVIAAEGEQKASRALKEASEVIAESSSALQLRYLQVQLIPITVIKCYKECHDQNGIRNVFVHSSST